LIIENGFLQNIKGEKVKPIKIKVYFKKGEGGVGFWNCNYDSAIFLKTKFFRINKSNAQKFKYINLYIIFTLQIFSSFHPFIKPLLL